MGTYHNNPTSGKPPPYLSVAFLCFAQTRLMGVYVQVQVVPVAAAHHVRALVANALANRL